MYGAVIGDILGKPYEFSGLSYKLGDDLFVRKCYFSDDTVMTVAVANALHWLTLDATEKEVKRAVIKEMQRWGRRYPWAGYGGMFHRWIFSDNPEPYGSYGNGSAMRVSPVGWLYDSIDRTRQVARWTAEVTHNHPEGVKGAEAVASVIFLARTGHDKKYIRDYVIDNFGYKVDTLYDVERGHYSDDISCQVTVPKAIIAFLESSDFEDALKKAIYMGGDTDTIGAMTGSMAEAFYGGLPLRYEVGAKRYITPDMRRILNYAYKKKECLSSEECFAVSSIITDAVEKQLLSDTAENQQYLFDTIMKTMFDGGAVKVHAFLSSRANMSDGRIFADMEYAHIQLGKGKNAFVCFTSDEAVEIFSGGDKDSESRVSLMQVDLVEFLEAFVRDRRVHYLMINMVPGQEVCMIPKEIVRILFDIYKGKSLAGNGGDNLLSLITKKLVHKLNRVL